MKFELWKIKNESYVIKVFAIQKKRPFTAVVKKWRKTFRNEICKIWFWFCIILYHAQLLINHVHLYLKVGVTLNVNLPMDAISTICHFNANFIFISIIFDVLILSFLNPKIWVHTSTSVYVMSQLSCSRRCLAWSSFLNNLQPLAFDSKWVTPTLSNSSTSNNLSFLSIHFLRSLLCNC